MRIPSTILAALVFAMMPVWADDRPNVIVIMADDLGYGDIGCFGSQRIKTPHLDRLAAEGMRLSDFHSSGPVCSPTRAGLITGRYQQRAGVPAVIVADPTKTTHPHGIQDREVTFAETFAEAGYQTAIFGKWHLGYYKKYNPVRHGFGQFRGYISGNVDFFSHVDQAGRLDWWRDDEIEDEPGYTTHLITQHSLAFIAANRDKAFCLYMAYEPPHYPYQGPGDKPIRSVGKSRGAAEKKQTAADIERAYREMVEEMDKGIGEVVAALRQHDLDRKTMVMFFSDNGATARGSNGPLRGQKGQLWEGGHRVPFVGWWPGRIYPGSVSDNLAITLDVMPTILAAAGIDPPPDLEFDGTNLMPLLTRGESPGERRLFWGFGDSRAMREGPWKLMKHGTGKKRPELFNLVDDIGEKNNLADQHPERLARMLAAINTWEKETTADAPQQPNLPPIE